MQELKKIPTEELVAELLSRDGVKKLKVLKKGQCVYIYGSKKQTQVLPVGTAIVAICPDQTLG